MRKLGSFLLLGVLAAGCASSGPPVEQKLMTDTELAIRNAESAGAPERAPDLLSKSRRSFEAARKASAAGDEEEARQRLAEATAYAAAAESRAKAEKLKADAARVRREAEELEMKTKQIRERARGGQ